LSVNGGKKSFAAMGGKNQKKQKKKDPVKGLY